MYSWRGPGWTLLSLSLSRMQAPPLSLSSRILFIFLLGFGFSFICHDKCLCTHYIFVPVRSFLHYSMCSFLCFLGAGGGFPVSLSRYSFHKLTGPYHTCSSPQRPTPPASIYVYCILVQRNRSSSFLYGCDSSTRETSKQRPEHKSDRVKFNLTCWNPYQHLKASLLVKLTNSTNKPERERLRESGKRTASLFRSVTRTRLELWCPNERCFCREKQRNCGRH